MRKKKNEQAPAVLTEKDRKLSKSVRDKLQNRLIATEYLRNGLNLNEAYTTVTRKSWRSAQAVGIVTSPEFLHEVGEALSGTTADKNRVLSLLWAQAVTSPLDYMDDDGKILTIKELKQLPRELQALIEEVKIQRKTVALVDENGKVVKDDEGKEVTTEVEYVHLKFPSKQMALDTIAKIGKMIGPQVAVQNNFYSFDRAMAEADARVMELGTKRAMEQFANEKAKAATEGDVQTSRSFEPDD